MVGGPRLLVHLASGTGLHLFINMFRNVLLNSDVLLDSEK